MKLLIAIVQDKDANRLSNEFIDHDIRATRLSTTGGFLKSGNTTFMIGLEDERVDEVLDMIKEASHTRQQFMTPPVNLDAQLDSTSAYPVEVQVGGATVFVMPVEQFHRFRGKYDRRIRGRHGPTASAATRDPLYATDSNQSSGARLPF